jgi:hypothetical protein
MKQKRYADEQIAFALRQAAGGRRQAEGGTAQSNARACEGRPLGRLVQQGQAWSPLPQLQQFR